MGWIIDEDHISEPNAANWRRKKRPGRIDGPTTKFRIYDDDDVLYYSGRITDNWLNGGEDLAFAPLDYAQADAGATRMDYFEDGEWKTL